MIRKIPQSIASKIHRCLTCGELMQLADNGDLPEHRMPLSRAVCIAQPSNHTPATANEIHQYLWRSK